MGAYPFRAAIEEALQKLLCAFIADVAVGVDQRVVLDLDEHFRLRQRAAGAPMEAR